jgi:hypothetical protein
MKKLFLFISISIFLGCATTIPDKMTKLDTFDPTNQVIIIKSFDLNPDIATDVNKAYIIEFGKEIALDIQNCFYSKGYKNIRIDGDPNDGDYLIKGKITELSGGNKHQRIWLGFGYGGTIASARGEIINLKKSKTLIDFNITKQSNWTYSNNEAAIRENIYEIAVELVNKALEKP